MKILIAPLIQITLSRKYNSCLVRSFPKRGRAKFCPRALYKILYLILHHWKWSCKIYHHHDDKSCNLSILYIICIASVWYRFKISKVFLIWKYQICKLVNGRNNRYYTICIELTPCEFLRWIIMGVLINSWSVNSVIFYLLTKLHSY